MPKLITSQPGVDWAVVEVKKKSKDFNVLVTTPFQLNGETVSIVLDGHHAWCAATSKGVTPNYQYYEIGGVDIEKFMEERSYGGQYRFLETWEIVQ